MLTKKQKGDIGLTQVIADLTKKGISVSIPISEHLKYDLVAEYKGKLLRVQVKYSKLNDDSFIAVKLKSVWSNKSGSHIIKRKQGDYDVLSVYCPDTAKIYYVKDNDFKTGTALYLRTRNDNVAKNLWNRLRMADDYLDCEKVFG